MNPSPPNASEVSGVTTGVVVAESTHQTPWWKNAPAFIAGCGFLLSLVTAMVSTYTAYKKDIHDQQAELSSAVEKLLNIPIAKATLDSKNSKINLDGVFSEQSRMLTLEAYSLARRLGSYAPAPELMNVALHLRSFENYQAAKQIWRQATIVADNFSDEVSAIRAYGLAMISLAQSSDERAEGERQFEKAMDIGAKYPDVARDPAEIAYTHALTQLAWTDAWSGFDCAKAEFHLQQADKFVNAAMAGPGGPQVQAMAKPWHESLAHCENGALSFQWRSMARDAAQRAPAPGVTGQSPAPTPNQPPPTPTDTPRARH